jgi:hypothetical protein
MGYSIICLTLCATIVIALTVPVPESMKPLSFNITLNRRAVKPGTSGSSSSKNDDDMQIIIGSVLNTNSLEIIIQQIITEYYYNNSLTQSSNNSIARRSSNNYNIDSTISCTTTSSTDTFGHTMLSTQCTNSGSVSMASCFSGDEFVYVEFDDKYIPVQMKDLKNHIGKNILSYVPTHSIIDNRDDLVGSQLMSFPHIDDNKLTMFLNISTKTSHIFITGNHLTYKLGDDKETDVRTFADQLKIGDYIVVYKKHEDAMLIRQGIIAYEQITDIKAVYKIGIYAPMTIDGYPFFVNNVLASPYSSFDHIISDYIYYYYSKYIAQSDF